MTRRPTALPAAAAELALAALWLGGAIVVAAAVAPAAFAVLPSRALAGALVGRVLPVVFWWGLFGGLAAAFLARAGGRGRLVTTGTVAGLMTAISCAAAQFVVAPRIEQVRATITGPVDALPPGDARRVEFGRLHGASVLWLGAGMLAATVSAVSAGLRLRDER